MRHALLPPLALVLLLVAACGRAQDFPEPPVLDTTDTRARDLLSLLQERGDLRTFTRLADTVGITAQLRGVGPLTLFAPTDAAFRQARLNLDTLLQTRQPPAPVRRSPPARRPDTLHLVLRHHIARGRYLGQHLGAGPRDTLAVVTLLHEPVTLRRRAADSALVVEGRPILASIVAENGVLHVLGALLPPPDTTVVEALRDRARRPAQAP